MMLFEYEQMNRQSLKQVICLGYDKLKGSQMLAVYQDCCWYW